MHVSPADAHSTGTSSLTPHATEHTPCHWVAGPLLVTCVRLVRPVSATFEQASLIVVWCGEGAVRQHHVVVHVWSQVCSLVQQDMALRPQ
jgi:hypothetical protein